MKILKITDNKNEFAKGVTVNGYFFVMNRITQNYKLFDNYEQAFELFEQLTNN